MISMKKLAATAGVAATLALGLSGRYRRAGVRLCCLRRRWRCWRTDHRCRYRPRGVQAQVHPDSWYFHQDWAHDNDHHYRDHHDGRGYYRNGVWVVF